MNSGYRQRQEARGQLLKGYSRLWAVAAGIAAAVFLFPADAFAWGGGAHVYYGQSVLDQIGFVYASIRPVLERNPLAFIYGTVGADICVWKRTKKWDKHVHNWDVAFPLVERARTDVQRAFAWGYLAHLAADTVAHNYFVPTQLVKAWSQPNASHPYWEMRFDAALLERLGPLALKAHDQHYREVDPWLESIIETPVLPFSANKSLFRGMLIANTHPKFIQWVQRQDRVSARQPDRELAERARHLALKATRDFFRNPDRAPALKNDPTGKDNLAAATGYRIALKRDGRLPAGAPGVDGRDMLGVEREFAATLAGW